MGQCQSEQPVIRDIYSENQNHAHKRIFDLKSHEPQEVQQPDPDLMKEIDQDLEKLKLPPKQIQLPPFNYGEKLYLNAETRAAFKLQDGATYIGEWIGDEMTGQGVLLSLNGKYEGHFVNGKFHGRGRFTFVNGDIYEGQWVHGVCEGFGTLYFTNGVIYSGEWKSDQKNGQGSETFPNGARYEGGFLSNMKHGQGVYVWKDGTKYTGSFEQNQITGFGVMEYWNGRRYEGHYREGKMHGQGKFMWADGRVYEGNYYQDRKDGYGELKGKDFLYKGKWKDGKMDGEGVLLRQGKPEMRGIWKNNQLLQDQ